MQNELNQRRGQVKSRDVRSSTWDPVLKCVTCQVQHTSVLFWPFKDQARLSPVLALAKFACIFTPWLNSSGHDSPRSLGNVSGSPYQGLIWSAMSQPNVFGLVSLFCMKLWFIMKTFHIVFMKTFNLNHPDFIRRWSSPTLGSHRSDLEDSGVTSRRDLRGSQKWGESWKVSGTGSLTESSTREGDLNNKYDSANTWPWVCITKGWGREVEEDQST